MTTEQLLNAYREYAAADAEATSKFDLLNFPDFPQTPEMTVAARAGEVIHRRGSVKAALVEAEYSVEDPDCPEQLKEAYQLVIKAKVTKKRKDATMQGAIEMQFQYGNGRGVVTEYVILPIHEFRNSGPVFAVADDNGAHLLSADDIRGNWDAWVGELVDDDQIVASVPADTEVY